MAQVSARGNEWDNWNLRLDFAFFQKEPYFNRLIDGSWITIYACLKSEWKPRADYIQTEADEILNPRYTCTHNGDDTHKSKDVAKPNERGQR